METEIQTNDQREELYEIEKILLAEEPYADQIVIEEENTEIPILPLSEETSQNTISELKEQDIEKFTLWKKQITEFKDMEASSLTTTKDGFKDPKIIQEDETDQKKHQCVGLDRMDEDIKTPTNDEVKEEIRKKEFQRPSIRFQREYSSLSVFNPTQSKESPPLPIKSMNYKGLLNRGKKISFIKANEDVLKEYNQRNSSSENKAKNLSENGILADCNKLFPLNQGKGNYWSVMREYVKRFELLEGLDELCQEKASIVEVKNYLRNTFAMWSEATINKNRIPKLHHKILNINISDYIDTLRTITCIDKGFYKISFDLNKLKDQISLSGKPMCYFKNAFCAGLLNHYRITKHWEGTLFKIPEREMDGEKFHRSADIFTFNLRSGIFQYRELLEQSIVKKLKEINNTSLGKNFKNPANLGIEKIWSKYYLTPLDIMRDAISEGNEKQNVLEEFRVHFRLLDARLLFISLLEEFNNLKMKNPDFNERFRKVFCNSNFQKHCQKLNPIMEATIEDRPIQYVNQNTIRELKEPILWMGNQLRFASPTNESIKSGAIRYFLDIALNSPEGRNILIKAGMIDYNNNSRFICDWSTGIGTSTKQQASGLLDALVKINEDNDRSIVKFGVEIIGSDKIKQGPLASLKYSEELRHSVIGDFLRIACNSAGGIPGIVVVTSTNHHGDLVYTVFKYDTKIGENLQKYGATFAIDLNRIKVKRILQKGDDVVKMLRETYGDTDIIISENILRVLPKYNTLGHLYRFYFDIVSQIALE